MNKKLKELFEMTRRERRGTIVLLVLMSVIITVTSIVCNRKDDLPQTAALSAVEAFEAQADSTGLAEQQLAPHKSDKKRKPSKRRAAKKSKPSSDKPRRLDPVPQF